MFAVPALRPPLRTVYCVCAHTQIRHLYGQPPVEGVRFYSNVFFVFLNLFLCFSVLYCCCCFVQLRTGYLDLSFSLPEKNGNIPATWSGIFHPQIFFLHTARHNLSPRPVKERRRKKHQNKSNKTKQNKKEVNTKRRA